MTLPTRQETAKRRAEFEENGYVKVSGLIDAATVDLLRRYIDSESAKKHLKADTTVARSIFAYGDAVMEEVLLCLLPRIENESGRKLYPTYSYYRVYQPGANLMRHTDREACEISVSVNILSEADTPWPLWVENGGRASPIALNAGDGLLYRGCDCPHWREPFTGTRSAQVFLHYVDRVGPHASYLFDKRSGLSVKRR